MSRNPYVAEIVYSSLATGLMGIKQKKIIFHLLAFLKCNFCYFIPLSLEAKYKLLVYCLPGSFYAQTQTNTKNDRNPN